jgi:TPR repeat protein
MKSAPVNDKERAAAHYQRSCDGGIGQACLWLAIMLEQGDGIAKDVKRAKRLRKQACKVGRPRCTR